MRHMFKLTLLALVLAPLWAPVVLPPDASAASLAMLPHEVGDALAEVAEHLPLPEDLRLRAASNDAARGELSGDLGSALTGLCDGTLMARLNGESLRPPSADPRRGDCDFGEVTDVGAFLDALEHSL